MSEQYDRFKEYQKKSCIDYENLPNKKKKDGKQTKVGKYESLGRHKYRQAFGEFPKEMKIFHKDGDILNNNIENLELISRTECLKRNMYKTKKPCVICGVEFLARVKKCKTCSIECRKEYNKLVCKEYSKTHREKFKESSKKYRERNKEKIKKNAKIYREKNKEKIKIIAKKYRDKRNEKYKKLLSESETFKPKDLNSLNTN